MPQTFKRRYTNYNNILYKLTRLKLNPDEYKASKLIDEIKSSTMDDLTTNKTWLLEMAMELKGKLQKN